MTFDEYQEKSRETATYPLLNRNMVYPALKLAGESGELADKIGKHWRNNFDSSRIKACGMLEFRNAENEMCIDFMSANSLFVEDSIEIVKELGDVLWYVAALATELGYPLSIIAKRNLEKIEDRRIRDVIKSEGDNR